MPVSVLAGHRMSERVNVAEALFLVPPTGCALLAARCDLALALGLLNLLCNLYPVMLQRCTRGRLQAIMTRRATPRPGRVEVRAEKGWP
jgi:hypothetical protein